MSSRDNPPAAVVTSLSKSKTLLPLVDDWVKRGIVTGNLSVIPETVHFSRLFSVTKKNGGLRPILDLSYLNTFISTPALKMEGISSVLPHLLPGMWASSLDVTDAFLSVKLSQPIQRFFCFVLNGKVFMFLRLPFGLTSAPWAFLRLMRPIKKFLRYHKVRVSSFLDDFLIAALRRSLCSLHTKWTADLLEWLGFSINEKKSEREPKQTITYLGVQINLQNLSLALPPEHVCNILRLCQEVLHLSRVTRRQLEAVVGLLNFAAPMLQLGRLFLTPIIIWMNSKTSASTRDIPIRVDASLREALLPFTERTFLERPTSFRPSRPSLDITTDASDYGWSGVIGPHRVQDCWTPSESLNHINVKEMKAILFSLQFSRMS